MRCLSAWTAIIFLALSFQGCGDNPVRPDPPSDVPADIESFVKGQALPNLHTVDIVLERDGQLYFFMAEYGKLNDCNSGCFYSSGLGLKLEKRIGWIRFDDYEDLNLGAFHYFDIAGTDAVLFDNSMWSDLEAANRWAHWAAFLPVLAADTDTPTTALMDIAQLLHGYVSGPIVWALLENPNVRESQEILSVLANLPVLQGDPYELARQRARELLDEFDEPAPEVPPRSWVATDPIQCLENPWEMDWLETHDHDYDSYPRDMEDTYPIIRDYYKRQGIKIHDITTRWVYEVVCCACCCPVGYRLYLYVDDEDVPAMLERGYRLEAPEEEDPFRPPGPASS